MPGRDWPWHSPKMVVESSSAWISTLGTSEIDHQNWPNMDFMAMGWSVWHTALAMHPREKYDAYATYHFAKLLNPRWWCQELSNVLNFFSRPNCIGRTISLVKFILFIFTFTLGWYRIVTIALSWISVRPKFRFRFGNSVKSVFRRVSVFR